MRGQRQIIGPFQDNYHAELCAVLAAAERALPPVHFRSDSQYVVEGLTAGREYCLRSKGRFTRTWKMLWDILDTFNGQWAPAKVKGHATARDVAEGRVRLVDKQGNDAADTTARSGAAGHPRVESAVQPYCESILKGSVMARWLCRAIATHNAALEPRERPDRRPRIRVQGPTPTVPPFRLIIPGIVRPTAPLRSPSPTTRSPLHASCVERTRPIAR